MWQTRKFIYSLAQCLWLSILAGWDIQWGVPFQKVASSFDHTVLCGLTTTTRPMATKRGRVVTYYKELQPIKSHNPLNMLHDVSW